jgi:hypothetical protein
VRPVSRLVTLNWNCWSAPPLPSRADVGTRSCAATAELDTDPTDDDLQNWLSPPSVRFSRFDRLLEKLVGRAWWTALWLPIAADTTAARLQATAQRAVSSI